MSAAPGTTCPMPDSSPPVPSSTVIPLVPPAGRTTARRPGRPGPARQPLPDAVAIRSVAVPEAAPPYDDAPSALEPTRPSSRGPATRPSPAQRSPRQPATRPAAATATSRPAQPVADRAGAAWPSRFAQVLAETLAGSRPPEQITSWTTEQARRRISQLGPLLAAAHRPRVRRVILSSPTGGVLEMTVIVGIGGSVRALAVRLEQEPPSAQTRTHEPDSQHRTEHVCEPARWLCTAVEAA